MIVFPIYQLNFVRINRINQTCHCAEAGRASSASITQIIVLRGQTVKETQSLTHRQLVHNCLTNIAEVLIIATWKYYINVDIALITSQIESGPWQSMRLFTWQYSRHLDWSLLFLIHLYIMTVGILQQEL